ncbi:hypothetical protein ARMA_1258 [Ardenticatena maritima]|uniref:Uncharacterized protein n=1 Tax=Ardenticatena maritima TaxID=872965 RepID=A0A0M8K6L1_9CHLR|nr:hypothetical protein ARMA_1258 [Ardenticatena maritima]
MSYTAGENGEKGAEKGAKSKKPRRGGDAALVLHTWGARA